MSCASLAVELRQRGMTERDIADALQLTEAAVRELLEPARSGGER
jgi:predicted transcriptional regulator